MDESTVLYAFSTYILRKGLEFNPGMSCTIQRLESVHLHPLLAPRLKIFNENLLPRRDWNPGPTEPEADMLPSEPARRAV